MSCANWFVVFRIPVARFDQGLSGSPLSVSPRNTGRIELPKRLSCASCDNCPIRTETSEFPFCVVLDCLELPASSSEVQRLLLTDGPSVVSGVKSLLNLHVSSSESELLLSLYNTLLIPLSL